MIDAVEELRVVAGRATFPAILKTARLGYDGKGQISVDTADDLGAAWDDLGGVPCVLEQRVDLDGEVSVIIARSSAGSATLAYPLCANIHRNGILDVTVAPGPYVPEAYAFAERIVTALGLRGGARRRAVRHAATACWSTSSPRARTTAGTGRSTTASPASSSSRCARCAVCHSATRR